MKKVLLATTLAAASFGSMADVQSADVVDRFVVESQCKIDIYFDDEQSTFGDVFSIAATRNGGKGAIISASNLHQVDGEDWLGELTLVNDNTDEPVNMENIELDNVYEADMRIQSDIKNLDTLKSGSYSAQVTFTATCD